MNNSATSAVVHVADIRFATVNKHKHRKLLVNFVNYFSKQNTGNFNMQQIATNLLVSCLS
jgi:hypothetical protein